MLLLLPSKSKDLQIIWNYLIFFPGSGHWNKVNLSADHLLQKKFSETPKFHHTISGLVLLVMAT